MDKYAYFIPIHRDKMVVCDYYGLSLKIIFFSLEVYVVENIVTFFKRSPGG